MLFPMVLLVYFFLIYAGFYQYDRCILEQDLRLAVLKGSRMSCADNQELMDEVYESYREIHEGKQAAMVQTPPQFRFSHGKICGTVTGEMPTPVLQMLGMGRQEKWSAEVYGESSRWNPVMRIRLWNRMRREFQDGNGGRSE